MHFGTTILPPGEIELDVFPFNCHSYCYYLDISTFPLPGGSSYTLQLALSAQHQPLNGIGNG
jgi:hypothetical protein